LNPEIDALLSLYKNDPALIAGAVMHIPPAALDVILRINKTTWIDKWTSSSRISSRSPSSFDTPFNPLLLCILVRLSRRENQY